MLLCGLQAFDACLFQQIATLQLVGISSLTDMLANGNIVAS